MTSVEGNQERCEKGNEDPRRPIEHSYPPAAQGLNSWSWDMQSDDVPCINNIKLHAGFSGPSVAPGDYTARVTLGDATSSVDFEVTNSSRPKKLCFRRRWRWRRWRWRRWWWRRRRRFFRWRRWRWWGCFLPTANQP